MKQQMQNEIKMPDRKYFSLYTTLSWIHMLLFIKLSYEFLTWMYYSLYKENMSYFIVVNKILNPFSVLTLIIINLFYLSIYVLRPPSLEKYKINNLPWPWEEDPDKFKRLLKKSIITYIFNVFCFGIYTLLFGYINHPELSKEKHPSIIVYAAQIYFCAIFEDFFFYWGHRILHHPNIYSKIHKQHHEFYNVINITSLYAHPIEFLLSNVVPLLACTLVLGKRIHMVTFMGFALFRILETNETHSGYEFPWSMYQILPFATDATYHNFHHLKNIGNYGSMFRCWDTLFQTNRYYYKLFGNTES